MTATCAPNVPEATCGQPEICSAGQPSKKMRTCRPGFSSATSIGLMNSSTALLGRAGCSVTIGSPALTISP
jgi:hypothetical protein